MRNGYEQLFPLDRLGEEVTVAKSMGFHTVVKPVLIVGGYKDPNHTTGSGSLRLTQTHGSRAIRHSSWTW